MTERAPAPRAPLSVRLAGVELVVLSFVVLFQELALIRWLPAQVRVAAYFPNLVLIAAFLGLGIGSLRARRGSLLWLWPVSLLALAGAAVAMSGVAFTAEGTSEFLWLLYADLGEQAPVVPSVRLPIVVLFVLTAVSFVGLGQAVARRLNVFRARSSSLWGYAFDLTGSLVGVVGFAVASFVGTFPIVWFAVVAVAGAVVVAARPRDLLAYGAAMALLLATVASFERAETYSPYYALSTESFEGTPSMAVRTNGSLHQVALDLDEPRLSQILQGYRLPYRTLRRPPEKVLVLGAGTGNDVAIALEAGAREVHAVEIDPGILELGRRHPADPYADPRVTVFQTDARSHLNETKETYDLIVFGTLDSMTRLSALSNVRLDNFVYTRDALEAAASRLTDDGGLVLHFMVGEPFIWEHLIVMLAGVFDEVPVSHQGGWQLFNTLFLAGPAFEHVERPALPPSLLDAEANGVVTPTDDWPYLYLPEPQVGTFYLSLMALFLAIAVGAVALASPDVRRGLVGKGADVEMFLFGMAFLLLETRFVTDMNLVWGATWLTSAVVFGSILFTILVATVVMELRPMSWRVASLGLLAALVVTYLVPTEALLAREVGTRLLLSVLFVGAPVFFAAACFALRFKEREAVDVAFGWNLLGAVAGGLLEFFSMAVGLKALVLVALAAYLGAFLLKAREAAARDAPGDRAAAPVEVG